MIVARTICPSLSLRNDTSRMRAQAIVVVPGAV